MIKTNKIKTFLNKRGPTLTILVLIVIFLSYSGFLALNLKEKIIPDEPAHFTFSKHFSTTLGIPPDTYETYSWGWYIEQNPFLYYWINGRIINLIKFVNPGLSDLNLLIGLRLVSVLYSLGTVYFCYLLSKEVIKHQWWQLLPVFLLTNTLMFVFISGGIHYDNLANFLSMASLYFLVRSFKRKNFLINSFAWMISIALACLVKYTILPLALALTVSWLAFFIMNYKVLLPLKVDIIKTIILSAVLAILLIVNFSVYGVNLIRYQSLTPPCREILLESQCEISKYEQRYDDLALDTKLTIQETLSSDYPSPFRYIFVDWMYHILLRSFGLSGHQAYFPYHLIKYYQILFCLVIILLLLNLFFWRSFSFEDIHLLGIAAFYGLVVFLQNYNSELIYGFRQVAVQGRYLFPVIGGIYVLFSQSIKRTPIRFLCIIILIFNLGLFLLGGPLTFLINSQTFLSSWFR